MNSIDSIVQWLEQQRPFVIVRIYEVSPSSAFPLGTAFIVSEENVEGDYPVGKQEIVLQARASLAAGKTETRTMSFPEATLDVCFEVISRADTLVIVGAGHIAIPLAKMADVLGFHLVILDDREEYANSIRFPMADQIVVAPFAEGLSRLPLDKNSYIVLLTRGHMYDCDCLKEIIDKEVAYIGMICSQRRKESAFQLMREAGYRQESLDGIYAPVGLPTGGETPEEIALSILSEIVALRNRGKDWVWKTKNAR